MAIEVDQSWRFERTNKPTVLGFSNEKQWAIVIPAQVKKAVFAYLEAKSRRQTMNVIRLFAASLVLLLQSGKVRNEHLLIDVEYPGYDQAIKDLVHEFAQKAGIAIDPDRLQFGRIGKRSPAHWLVYDVFTQKRKANKVVREEELFALLLPKKEAESPSEGTQGLL
jgi:hypothetical protein